jgi:hypothetical protein
MRASVLPFSLFGNSPLNKGRRAQSSMARRRQPPGTASVTPVRAGRLFRLLTLLAAGPQSRTTLTRRLRLGIRGFYRDLEALRLAGITVTLANGKYALVEPPELAIDRLPFPDPGLLLGEARVLARGRSPGHKKIRAQLHEIEN